MGRIKKTAGPKHEASLPPALAAFVKKSTELPLYQLPAHLSSLDPRWPFPRGDLYNWIPMLNRFDHILELFNEEYGLCAGPQTQPFGRRLLLRGDAAGSPAGDTSMASSDGDLDGLQYGPEADRELVESALAFSTLLMENCGNRSLYSSSERLNDLLNTTSLSLLSRTLRLAVRCAQRYLVSRQRTVGSGQHHNPSLLASHYNINLDRIHMLARPFVKTPLRGDTAPSSTPVTPSSKGKEKAGAGRDAPPPSVQATDLISIARGDDPTTPTGDHDWKDWGNVSFTYFPDATTNDPERKNSQDADVGTSAATETPTTPTPVRRTPSGGQHPTPRRSRLSGGDDSPSSVGVSPSPAVTKDEDERQAASKTIQFPNSALAATPAHELLAHAVPSLPADGSRYELTNRVRTAHALSTSLETRREMLGIRILAITNLAYIHPEPTFQQKILQQDSDEPRRLQLAYQFAELVHPQGDGDFDIPRWLQTLAIGGLEALAKHKSRVGDVAAALNVNVNHGVLLYVIRRAVAEMATDAADDARARDEDEWRDALFALLAYLPETARTGEALVAAGLLPILLEVLTLRTDKAERNHPKVLNFLDTFVYHMRDAFQTLANARGLEIISDLTAYEVTSGFDRARDGEGMPPEYRNQVIDYELPFFQQQTLRALFKFMNHMMSHGGGNFDRLLRNLIDSPPLLAGLRLILGSAAVFGSNVWSGAVNIMSNFIHNEPTSYAVIAEAGLTRAFLEAVSHEPIPDEVAAVIDAPEREAEEAGRATEPTAASTPAPNGSDASSNAPAAWLDAALESAAAARSVLEPVGGGGAADARKISSERLMSLPVPRGDRATGILPSSDAILTVPQAFGAICLNARGMTIFEKSLALPCFFEVFLSPAHVKCMHADDDLPNILGSAFDELVRHHPPLKKSIMISVLFTLVSVGQLCRSRAREDGVGSKLWVVGDDDGLVTVAGGRPALVGRPKFVQARAPTADPSTVASSSTTGSVAKRRTDGSSDVEMSDADAQHSPESIAAHYHDLIDREDEKDRPSVATYLDVMAKFLTGFFSNTAICSTFLEIGGAEWLLDLAELPSLQYDFNNASASHSFAKCVHLLVEQKPHLVLPSLVSRAQAAVDELQSFSEHDGREPYFARFVQNPPVEREYGGENGKQQASTDRPRPSGTNLVKSLVKVHTLCNVLRETFAQPLFQPRSSQTVFTQVNLADLYTRLVTSLGALQRACVWEEIQLQKLEPELWKDAHRIKSFGTGSDEVDKILGLLPTEDGHPDADGSDDPANSTTPRPPSTPGASTLPSITAGEKVSGESRGGPTEKSSKLARTKNAQTLRYLLGQVPATATPFLQGLGKVLVAKRQSDTYQKQNAVMVADAIAATVIDQLRFTPPGPPPPSPRDMQSYWIAMLTSLSRLMIELPQERPQSQSLTIVLQAFKNQGGFDAVKHVLNAFFDEVKRHGADDEDGSPAEGGDAASRLSTAYAGIKIVLALFSQVVSSKTIIEASQTAALASRDRDKDKHDYFSPNQFLVELRTAVLPVVRSMWESDMVDRADSSIAKNLIDILRTILEADHEAGAYKRSDKLSRRDKSPPKQWKESSQHHAKLVAEGCDDDLAREALYRTNNNLSLAEDYCKALRLHDRALRLPFPDRDRRPSSRTQTDGQESTASAAAAAAAATDDTAGEAANGAAPPATTTAFEAPVDRPNPVENPAMEIEEAGADPSPEASRPPPPPPAPAIPADDDLPDNEGLLAMNLDHLLGDPRQLNVPTPPLRDGPPSSSWNGGGGGGEASNDASTQPPSRDPGTTEVGKMSDIVTVDDLDEQRVAIRANLIDRALDILNVHGDVTFELARLIMAAVSKSTTGAELMRGEIGETLVQSLISLQMEDDFRPAGKKIAAYANLLALILQDRYFYDATLPELKANFSTLLGFIRVFPDQPAGETTSPWIGQILLIIEKLLAEDAQPRPIKWTPPSEDGSTVEPPPMAELEEAVVPEDQKTELFDAIIEILPRIGKDESLALSVARALVMLTRDRGLARRLGERRHLQRLFVMIKQLAGMTTDKLQGAMMLILRHVIEDEETIRQIMRSEIRVFFESRQNTRQLDTNGYVRSLYHLVLRHPEIFVEVSNEMLKLSRFDSNNRHQLLSLKETKPDGSKRSTPGEGEKVGDARPETPEAKEPVKVSTESPPKEKGKTPHADIKAPVVEHPDGIIHYLLSELLSYKEVDDKEITPPAKKDADGESGITSTPDVEMTNGERTPPSGASHPPPVSTETKKADRVEFRAEQHPIYIYRCFLLQCLTELLSCYNRTKVEFINFSRKAHPQAMTPSKPRSGVLNYILNDLIPVGTLHHAEDIAFRKRFSTSNWAIAAIVALCSKTGERSLDRRRESSDGEDEPDLLFVRKFVLEHALKAYRDASASGEALDGRYARMLSLSDLFNRMLTGRPISGGNSASAEMIYASQKQLARIMFEKNYISALTGSIADIDLNFPSAKRAVKYILRPLKQLTQTAIELSESASISTTPGATDEDEISSATSVSDLEGREETPDLFRNSTLGMFEPGREPETSSGSSDEDDDDDDMYDDGEEMEYEEEHMEEDEVISDEEEEIEGMEGLPGDMGLNVEVVLNGDGDEMDSDDDGDDSEDDEDDDGDDIEIVDEINEDDANDSAGGDEGEDWQSEDEDEEAYDDEADLAEDADGHHHHHRRDGHLEHIVRALEGDDGGDMMQHLEGGDLHMDLDPDNYMEEALQDDEDEEDDDEDLEDDEEAIYEREFDEDTGLPSLPWGWDAEGDADMIARGHHHHSHHRRGPGTWSQFLGGPRDPGMMGNPFPAYRTHRPAGAGNRGIDDGTNPLLQRSVGPSHTPLFGRLGRPDVAADWLTANENGAPPGRGLAFHDSPASIINNIINVIGHGGGPPLAGVHQQGGALHFHVAGGPFPSNMPREIQAMLGMRRSPQEAPRPVRDDPAQAVNFVLSVTSARWQEEARILFGSDYADKTHRVINALLAVLVPQAIEEEKARREQREKEQREREERRKQKEEEEKRAQEQRDKEAKEAEEAAAKAAAEEAAADEPAGEDDDAESKKSGGEGATAADADAETSGDQEMEGVESTQAEPAASGAEAAANTPARVHTTIRGRELDITGMDIDPEYLEALPEELREEVIRQQAVSGDQPTDISREFLEALPEDIREELLEQEAQDRRRREREEARRTAAAAAAGGPPQVGAEEMDPATVLAMLDPSLRQAILMEQDEDVLAQLPSALAAEARALGGDRRIRHDFMDATRNGRTRVIDGDDDRQVEQALKKPQRRAIVQMLDKAGVATLLRLMFIPQQGSARQTLNGILQNVCENRQTRHEVVTLLLSILQDGSADTSAVERSFAQLSLRARQPVPKTAQAAKRITNGQSPTNSSEMSPLMVIQQCLSSLVLLVHYNPHIPSFFLTEHDAAIGLKRGVNRKGKGKDSKASRYALNSLLGLLERKLIMESSPVMEQLSNLLNSVTQPLTLLKKDKEREAAAAVAAAVASDARAIEDGRAPDAHATTESPPLAAETEERHGSTGATTADGTDEQGDQAIPDAPAPDAAAAEAEASTSVVVVSDAAPDGTSKDDEAKAKKARHLVPPVIPEHNLRLVVNILAARECSAKTFRDTLSTINNLSAIPSAKDVFGNELLRIAQDLGRSILDDLTDLIPQILKARTGTDVQGMALAKFSPASSDQAKLLRVLTALDYLFDPKKDGATTADGETPTVPAHENLLSTLYENSTFGPLWAKLSECLSTIRKRENMLNVATILLPLIEALMVVCKNTTLKSAPPLRAGSREIEISSPVPESSGESLENLFFNFTEEHRKILNDLVRHNPKLMSGTFSHLVKNPKVLEFDNKRNYFTRRLHARGAETRHSQPPLQLSVRRDQVFPDSFKSLYFKTGEEMKYGKLSIRFHGEEGVDAGGVTREWFQALSRQMFNPDYALFTPVASDRTTFHPNRLSKINEEHFMYFKFIGRIIGKALYEGRVLDCHFSRAVYKRILGRPVSVKDMETLDLEYYKSLRWMLENDITDIITENFAVESEDFGESRTIDLKEDGRNVPVTEENKQEYVRLVVEYRLTGSVQEQLEHFLRGFHDIVPAELIAIFNEQELELLISGLPDIDVDDWKNNAEYHNYSASSSQIQWFWRAVRSFDKEERAKLLQFVTGTSKVPLNGFKELEGMNGFSRFNIHRDYGSKDRLPSSHTCFNQLDLPEYETYEALRQQVYTAMTAGSEYFGFA